MTPKEKSWELPSDWDETQPVVDWLKRIKNKAGYKREFSLFLTYVKKTPTEILEERKEHLKSEDLGTKRTYEEIVKDFVADLYSRGLKESTVRGYLRSTQSFFNSHFMALKFLRNEIRHEEIESVKANHRPKWVLDNIELRTMVEVCRTNYDKGLLLTIAHSGMSPVDVGQLLITDQLISDLGEKRHSYVEKRREKSTVLQQTFVSDESLYFIELYLKERKDYEIGDPLFITQKGNPIDSKYLQERFKQFAEIAFGEDRARDFKTKNLRDILYNACKLADLSEELTDSLLGWEKKGAKGNYRLNERVIRKAYEKIFQYLSIDGQTKSRLEFEDLKNALDVLTKDLHGYKKALDKATEKLEQWEPIIKMIRDKYPETPDKVPPHVDIGHERKRD